MRLFSGGLAATEVLGLTNTALYFVIISISFYSKNNGFQVGDSHDSINAEIHLPPGKTQKPTKTKAPQWPLPYLNGPFPIRTTQKLRPALYQ